MIIRDRIRSRHTVPYEQWRKQLRKDMFKNVVMSFGIYFAALGFTIWLLWG